ncbi:3-oxoacyl-[acyl-carrier protein] reductase [Dyella jiangningensis]|uniref:SDR family oxidoreductase n=2 Tax=Gammaproteobacteria TaxID=1236 RepID=UPI00088D9A15|nr:SDR family oxidoreductase [Dyella sp. AtDHG13]PXV56195.1 3-oxoacyl-[acyl-carrier protein] reductase [Dyella sp. AtDHG13]SDL49540.1 3-oxoacyl-[acyl-carrier protein] reductase [Dyella jiangningensis]
MQLDLSGRHALVCGASQGIGRASAIELAELGASVTLLSRSADALKAATDALPRKHGQQHRWFAVDMAQTDSLRDALADIVASHPMEILINNTGGPPGGAAHTATTEAYETAFRQHLLAGQTLVQALLPGMRASGYGRIVNVISTSVKEPIAGLGVSNTVRAAVASWAKTLSSELAADGITVNNVLPGYTRTARLDGLLAAQARSSGRDEDDIAKGMLAAVPARRFGEAAEVAAVIAFLCTPAAAYVNGVSIAVDGGRTRSLS